MNTQANKRTGKLLLKRQEISRQDLTGVVGGAETDSSEEIVASISKVLGNSAGFLSLGDESKQLARELYRSVPDWFNARDKATNPTKVPANTSKPDGSLIDTRRLNPVEVAVPTDVVLRNQTF